MAELLQREAHRTETTSQARAMKAGDVAGMPRRGASGQPTKSSINTDDSAKRKISHGVTQDCDEVTVVDQEYPVIVQAEAFEEAQELYLSASR